MPEWRELTKDEQHITGYSPYHKAIVCICNRVCYMGTLFQCSNCGREYKQVLLVSEVNVGTEKQE